MPTLNKEEIGSGKNDTSLYFDIFTDGFESYS